MTAQHPHTQPPGAQHPDLQMTTDAVPLPGPRRPRPRPHGDGRPAAGADGAGAGAARRAVPVGPSAGPGGWEDGPVDGRELFDDDATPPMGLPAVPPPAPRSTRVVLGDPGAQPGPDGGPQDVVDGPAADDRADPDPDPDPGAGRRGRRRGRRAGAALVRRADGPAAVGARRGRGERLQVWLAEAVAELRFVAQRPPSLVDHIAYARAGEWSRRPEGPARTAALLWAYLVAIPVSTLSYLAVWATARPTRAVTAAVLVAVVATALNAIPVVGAVVPDALALTSWPPLSWWTTPDRAPDGSPAAAPDTP